MQVVVIALAAVFFLGRGLYALVMPAAAALWWAAVRR